VVPQHLVLSLDHAVDGGQEKHRLRPASDGYLPASKQDGLKLRIVSRISKVRSISSNGKLLAQQHGIFATLRRHDSRFKNKDDILIGLVLRVLNQVEDRELLGPDQRLIVEGELAHLIK